jgi:hypothetical protein
MAQGRPRGLAIFFFIDKAEAYNLSYNDLIKELPAKKDGKEDSR